MPSSISSSDAREHEIHRAIPERGWLGMAATAAILAIAALIGWELHVRGRGYEPDYDNTPGLWVPLRAKASGATREQIVLVGASRTLFDIDLDVLQQATGGARPLQLATVGSSPMPIFTHLAEDPTYAGTTIVGVVPGLLAAPAGPPIETPKKFITKYENWSPADAWELPISLWLQEHLAFIHEQDLRLPALIGRIELKNRANARVPPRLPPNLATIDLDRRVRMAEWARTDEVYMREIQQIWIPLFTPPAKPDVFTDEQWAKMFADAWDAILVQAKANVEAITARGGRVIFVRHPSSGGVLELEEKYNPRAKFWDRLLEETGAPGIYWADYPELADFECPEWSHLSAADSVEYTKRLVAILKRERLL
ncbi:MAG: hypothetical protein K1X88_01730 [Nannocystaceae bacterium]|nr:hypothetical protein [Nannocystaceae bacterium]